MKTEQNFEPTPEELKELGKLLASYKLTEEIDYSNLKSEAIMDPFFNFTSNPYFKLKKDATGKILGVMYRDYFYTLEDTIKNIVNGNMKVSETVKEKLIQKLKDIKK